MVCWYMSGAGNDFMVIDARGKTLDFSALAIRLCAITGADGFMAVDNSDIADFRLHFYNSDGTRGEMCGNGSRCICRFAYDHGMVGKYMTVQTDAGIVEGWHLGENQYRVRLNNPSAADLHRTENAAYVELGDPGVPHSVTELPELSFSDKETLLPLALSLRDHPAFPKGVNVNFFTPLGENRVRVLTFERGVEDYTLACGTGCSSTAVTLWLQGRLPGGTMIAENEGGELSVTVTGEENNVTGVYLEGPAEVLQIFDLER